MAHEYAQTGITMRHERALLSANPHGVSCTGGAGETGRMPPLAVRAKGIWAAEYQLASGSSGSGFLLLNNADGDAPAVADRMVVVHGWWWRDAACPGRPGPGRRAGQAESLRLDGGYRAALAIRAATM
jgi:hypothetical protein